MLAEHVRTHLRGGGSCLEIIEDVRLFIMARFYQVAPESIRDELVGWGLDWEYARDLVASALNTNRYDRRAEMARRMAAADDAGKPVSPLLLAMSYDTGVDEPKSEYLPPKPRSARPRESYVRFRPSASELAMFCLAALGAIGLLVFCYLNGHTFFTAVTGTHADGVIVEKAERVDGWVVGRSGRKYPLVSTGFRVEYDMDGAKRETTVWATGVVEGWPVGKRLPVMFPASDPSAALPASFAFYWETDGLMWLRILSGIGGAIGLAIGLRRWTQLRQQRRQQMSQAEALSSHTTADNEDESRLGVP